MSKENKVSNEKQGNGALANVRQRMAKEFAEWLLKQPVWFQSTDMKNGKVYKSSYMNKRFTVDELVEKFMVEYVA